MRSWWFLEGFTAEGAENTEIFQSRIPTSHKGFHLRHPPSHKATRGYDGQVTQIYAVLTSPVRFLRKP